MERLFSKQEMKRRRAELVKALTGIDFAIIFNRADLFYYSGIGLDGVIFYDDEKLIRYVTRNLDLAKQYSSLPVRFMESFRLFKELGEHNSFEKIGIELDILPYKTVSEKEALPLR